MVGLREQHKQLTRQRLLESAVEVFSLKGYTNTSVDDLTSSAGASRATFYLHFTSKLDVLAQAAALAVQETPQYCGLLDDALASGSRDALVAAIDTLMGWYEAHSGLVQAWAEASFEDPALPRSSHVLLGRYLKQMPFLRSQWPGREEQAKLRLHLFISQLDRLFQVHAATGEWNFPRKAVIATLADIWATGFFPTDDAEPAPGASRARARRSAD